MHALAGSPLVSSLALALVLAAPAGARAQASEGASDEAPGDPGLSADRRDEEARNLFHAGEVAFGDGRFESALDYFQRAYELSGRGAMLYNIASAADRLRRDRDALEAFERYLREVPEAGNRAQVEARIAVLREAIARAESAEASAHVAPEPTTETVPPEEPASSSPAVGAWVLLAAGAAIAVGGGVSLGLAAADVASVEHAPPDTEWSTVADAFGRSEAESIAGAILLGVGGAAMVAGIVWAVLPSSESASVTVSVSPGGLIARGSF